jgi:predicted nucleic acid-binding protein
VRSVLADTGFFVGLFNQRDAYHEQAVRFLKSEPKTLLTTWPVITEVCFFLDAAGKAAFLTFIKRGGLSVEDISLSEVDKIIAIFRKYKDREVDLADASLIWLAERAGITQILTVDRQDFEVYRLSKNRHFSILL